MNFLRHFSVLKSLHARAYAHLLLLNRFYVQVKEWPVHLCLNCLMLKQHLIIEKMII